MTAPPVEPGTVLGGKFRVEKVLGHGGMGVVVAAAVAHFCEVRRRLRSIQV